MHKLMEYICNELEELERKADKEGKLSMAEVEYMDKLVHTKKNLLRAEELWEDSEYSEASGMGGGNYYSRARGGNQGGGGRGGQGGGGGRSNRGSYESRYSRMENAYEDGSFEGGSSMARGRGRNARRDSMGRYSRGDESEMMVEELKELMQEAPDERTKMEFQKFIQKIEQM